MILCLLALQQAATLSLGLASDKFATLEEHQERNKLHGEYAKSATAVGCPQFSVLSKALDLDQAATFPCTFFRRNALVGRTAGSPSGAHGKITKNPSLVLVLKHLALCFQSNAPSLQLADGKFPLLEAHKKSNDPPMKVIENPLLCIVRILPALSSQRNAPSLQLASEQLLLLEVH